MDIDIKNPRGKSGYSEPDGFFYCQKMTGIYKITSPTGRIYIGQSIDVKKRFASYLALRCKTQVLLYNSLKKHSPLSHKMEVVCECNVDELNSLECFYIILYDTFNTPHGLNLCSGGLANRVVSDITRRKMSESLSGNRNPFYGKKHSEETIIKMRAPKSEETRKKLIAAKQKISEETRARMSTSQKLKAPTSEISKLKMSIAQRGRKHSSNTKCKISIGNSKGVIQLDKSGNVITHYKSITEASIMTGIKRTTISGCVNGHCKTAGNFKWMKTGN